MNNNDFQIKDNMIKEEKVIFIDRDGVINEYPGDKKYVCSLNDFRFIPGSIEGIKKLYEKGFKLYIISNQAGVAKGLYSEQDLEKMNKKITKELKKNGVSLSGIFYCTHHPSQDCGCRKPKTGLLDKALSQTGAKPALTFFIGDSFKDMEAARSFGAKPVLVLSGREKISNRKSWVFEPDYVFDNLLVAAHYICAHYG
ncbi:MAG: HAD family hydrolase [Candidatus Omnitrophica bacterium]|nr:HAD family hydrolase [Candidatus Omnitrophota bacterium]